MIPASRAGGPRFKSEQAHMKLCLMDVENEENKIILRGVDEKNEWNEIQVKAEPYFYAMPATKENKKIIEKLKDVKKILIKNGEFKIFTQKPQDIIKIRNAIKDKMECKEYDISFAKKFIIDKKLYPFDWIEVSNNKIKKISNTLPRLKIVAFDIETINNQIILISLFSETIKKVYTYKKAKNVELLSNEKEMLKTFLHDLKMLKPHVIVTFNGDEFDFRMLDKKLKEYGLEKCIRFIKRGREYASRFDRFLHIDLFKFTSNILAPQLQTETFTLEDVSKELINDTKEQLSLEEMIFLWDECKIDKIVNYCLKDSELTYKLAKHLMPLIIELSRVTGLLPFDSTRLTFGSLVEWYLIRRAKEKSISIPENPHYDEMQKRRMQTFKGGYVKEPILGIHENIIVYDFRSLYPSIIVTFNISPETINCKCCNGDKEHFCKKRKGFIPSVVKEVLEERVSVKEVIKKTKDLKKINLLNERQYVLKILANSMYGYMGFPSARWYCIDCAKKIAEFGRKYIKWCIKEAEKFGFTVLYCDTDSLFVTGKKEKDAILFLKKINKKLPGIMELELEDIYVRGLFVPQRIGSYTAKKRYALLKKDGSIVVRGMEAVRRDWCNLAKILQKKVLNLVLKKKYREALKLVRETIERVKTRKVKIEDLAIRTQLGKELSEYKAKGPHVSVAKKLLKHGHKIEAGVILSYVIKKGKGSISDRAEPITNVTINDYDIEYYINNQILNIVLRILEILGYKKEDILGASLKRFFS